MRRRILFVLAIVTGLAFPTAASVRVVDPAGAGTFTDVQAAVNASADGDVLLIKTGNYARVEVNDKELALVADTGATVHIDGVRVRNLAATRTLLLSGLAVEGVGHLLEKNGLVLDGCSGLVFVETCRLSGAQADCCANGAGAVVVNCAAALFVRCTVRGSTGADVERPYGGDGFMAYASNVGVYDSTVEGGRGGQDCCCGGTGYGYTGYGGDGMQTGPGFLFASGSSFVGGHGGNANPPCHWDLINVGGVGGNGVRLGCPAWFLGATMSGGTGGTNNQLPGSAASGVALALTSGGQSNGLAGSARQFTLARLAREQQPATMSFTGLAGDEVGLFVSDRPAFRWQPASNGVLAIARRPPQLEQQVGVLGATGILAASWTVGELGSGLEARIVYFQPRFIDTQQRTILGTPRALVLLDSAF